MLGGGLLRAGPGAHRTGLGAVEDRSVRTGRRPSCGWPRSARESRLGAPRYWPRALSLFFLTCPGHPGQVKKTSCRPFTVPTRRGSFTSVPRRCRRRVREIAARLRDSRLLQISRLWAARGFGCVLRRAPRTADTRAGCDRASATLRGWEKALMRWCCERPRDLDLTWFRAPPGPATADGPCSTHLIAADADVRLAAPLQVRAGRRRLSNEGSRSAMRRHKCRAATTRTSSIALRRPPRRSRLRP